MLAPTTLRWRRRTPSNAAKRGDERERELVEKKKLVLTRTNY
jgi:hypothetical protein